MSSTPSYSSTTSLVSKTSFSKESPPKNYEAAFGTLVSSFGFGNGQPTLPQKVVKTPKSRQTPGVVVPSAPPASVHTSYPAPKNYEAAFGSLSSSYGFGGTPYAPSRSKA